MVEPQIVYLVNEDQRMTIAIRGVQTRVTREHDDFEVIQNHDSEETASREFARWLARVSAEGWDLDPEFSPNPAAIEQPYGFEPMSEAKRLWRKARRTEEDLLVVDLGRLQARGGDSPVATAEHPVWMEVWEQLQAANPEKLRITGASSLLTDPLPPGSIDACLEVELGKPLARTAADDHGDLATVLNAMPSLTSMVASGTFWLTEVEHGTLQSLALAGEPLSTQVLSSLSRATMPALRSLSLRLSWDEDADEGTLKSLTKIIKSPTGQGLEELTVEGGVYPEEVLAAVLEAQPKGLKRLTLRDEFSDVEGAIDLLKKNEALFAETALAFNTEAWEDEEIEYLESAFTVAAVDEDEDEDED
jgi:hypothetical protein